MGMLKCPKMLKCLTRDMQIIKRIFRPSSSKQTIADADEKSLYIKNIVHVNVIIFTGDILIGPVSQS
jgi:hypothetical protein